MWSKKCNMEVFSLVTPRQNARAEKQLETLEVERPRQE